MGRKSGGGRVRNGGGKETNVQIHLKTFLLLFD